MGRACLERGYHANRFVLKCHSRLWGALWDRFETSLSLSGSRPLRYDLRYVGTNKDRLTLKKRQNNGKQNLPLFGNMVRCYERSALNPQCSPAGHGQDDYAALVPDPIANPGPTRTDCLVVPEWIDCRGMAMLVRNKVLELARFKPMRY